MSKKAPKLNKLSISLTAEQSEYLLHAVMAANLERAALKKPFISLERFVLSSAIQTATYVIEEIRKRMVSAEKQEPEAVIEAAQEAAVETKEKEKE